MTETKSREKITVIDLPVTALRSFEEHPYKVVDNEEMASLVDSIYNQGILTPITVRPLSNGEYEIVSGHRRLFACLKLGIKAIPAIVKELSREDAILEMVDSNLHREHILPSEKAKAYKMKMDAMKRQGERTDLTLSPMATKSAIDSAAEIGSAAGESRDQVFRYIRLNLLIPELLDMVDEGRIAFRPAVELSHLRYIFQLCIEGLGPTQIAHRLEDEKVICPTAYYMSLGRKTSNPMPKRGEYAWETSTIKHILANRQYTGCTVNFKTSLVSYKVHKTVYNPEEEWQIIPNTQEAIIDEDTFNRVQELRDGRRRNTATGRESLFSGLLYCADCGSKLYFCAAKSIKPHQEFHRCSAYKESRGGCTIHFIREVVLREMMLELVSRVALFIQQYEAVFLYMYAKKHNITKETNVRNMKAAIEKDKRRIAEIDTMIERLYEDNVLGKIPDDRFSKMMGKYEAEQKTLIEAVSKAEHSLKVFEQDKVDLRTFLETIRKCTDIKELTPEIVNRLIRRIEVHNSEKLDGRKRVKLDVYFTAAGLIDIPDENELREMMEEIRKSA